MCIRDRTSGVLMPISSLPSQYGIGTMGKEAKRFVDFLEKGGQTYWQILPILSLIHISVDDGSDDLRKF